MKFAVITGAASGIGAACVEEFHSHSYKIIGVDVQQPLEISAADLFHQFHIVDIAHVANITDFIAKLSDAVDHVDVLVNAAGIHSGKPIELVSEDDFDRIISINAKAPFFLTQKLLPLMTQGDYSDRSIVNISSVHATATTPLLSSYAASKGALTAMTRTMALELASKKIRVNAVQPGAINTPMLQNGFQKLYGKPGVNVDEMVNNFGKKLPVGRIGRAADIATAVYFLANENNSFITGTSLVVDGGVLSHLSTE
uniref:SDR family oxidoreductase n=1 Tax=Plectus sambesii TaxID=2011161 RepID=A0A914X8J9_9BILA